MNYILSALLFLSAVLAANAYVCSSGANLPGTSNGCYDAAGYVCQCATGIQQACSKSGVSIGTTSTWRKGTSVFNLCAAGTPPAKYTAIATFLGPSTDPYNGSTKHAALFVSCGALGAINVMDQYTGKSWGQASISDKGTTITSYNSRLYYVIV